MTGPDLTPQALERIKAAALQGLSDWAEYVLSEAVAIVPIDTAALQNSGTTAVDADTMTAYVGFGTGPAAAYAVRQHEVPMNHAPGRTDHYLSKPVQASEAVAEQIIARRIRQAFG
jgi:hypothetical protein